MLWLISSVFTWLGGFFRSRHDLGLEIIALRHQLAVLTLSTKRARLHATDRLFWVLLRRFFPRWSGSLLIIKPETVVAWHRKAFRTYWRFRSQPKKVGRPSTSTEIRAMVERMARENPTWGAPRVHGELLKLGVQVSRAHRLAVSVPFTSERQRRPTLADVPQQSPGGDCRDGFVHRHHTQFPDSVWPVSDPSPPSRNPSFQQHRASDQ